MFIKKIKINNFRLFKDEADFVVDDLNVPDGENYGSGLTIFVGENGCGKTSLIEALSLPLLEYRTQQIDLKDFFNPDEDIEILLFSDSNFTYKSVIPRKSYKGKGFRFKAGLRKRANAKYLSSLIIKDQEFVRADGETEPEDGKPDLRVSVNNPWSGSRFSENDIIFLDEHRVFQTKSGTYSKTRFDRLMEDFDYQYISNNETIENLNTEVKSKVVGIENDFLKEAIDRFNDLYDESLTLSYIDSWLPHSNAEFSKEKENNQILPLERLGSGYEIIFSLLVSFSLAKQSRKELIILIDEPELHLHPQIQEDIVNLLLEFSKTAQIIIATHSPLLIKQALYNDFIDTKIIKKDQGQVYLEKLDSRLLSYNSANEVNFLAFNLGTEEYHNELYEELKSQNGLAKKITEFDEDFFVNSKGEDKKYPNFGKDNEVSLHTYVRNQIHHRSTCGIATYSDLIDSIVKMRSFF